MICVSLQGKTYEEILSVLNREDVEMAEIRLDLCELSDEEIQDLFENSETPLIATARKKPELLEKAIVAGARFADLELEAPSQVSRNIQSLCKKNGTELIRSYHNYKDTPEDAVLQMTLARCIRYGADIVKIVTTAQSEDDVLRLRSLYSIVLEGVDSLEGRLIAFSMGEEWKASRLECLRRGAPFTYAALSQEEATAAGQWTVEEMRKALYGDFKPWRRKIDSVPASKSFAQRAIICAALAEGTSRFEGYTPCGDSEAALKVAEQLGAEVRVGADNVLEIKGIGPIKGKLHIEELNVGESGLLARMMIPLAAAVNDGSLLISGEKTLLKRPLTGAVNKMAAFGVVLRNKGEKAGGEIHVPLVVKGPLIPGTADVSGSDGSQLISGLMLALPLCSSPSEMYVGEPKSIPYMFITQDVMRKFGVRMTVEMEGNAEMLEMQDWSYCTGISFKIPAPQVLKAASFRIEGDWSAAANFLVAGAIFGGVEINGLDTSSVQADISILDILVEAGAIVSETDLAGTESDIAGSEAAGSAVQKTVCVRKAPLEAFETDLNNAPDIFPITAVLAAFCNGVSRIAGVGRLSAKESDRATAIIDMLSAMGVEAWIEEDRMMVAGESLSARLLNKRLLHGGRFTSRHDHRMVMALKVAELGADSPIEIDDTECVGKSFPEFSLGNL